MSHQLRVPCADAHSVAPSLIHGQEGWTRKSRPPPPSIGGCVLRHPLDPGAPKPGSQHQHPRSPLYPCNWGKADFLKKREISVSETRSFGVWGW